MEYKRSYGLWSIYKVIMVKITQMHEKKTGEKKSYAQNTHVSEQEFMTHKTYGKKKIEMTTTIIVLIIIIKIKVITTV